MSPQDVALSKGITPPVDPQRSRTSPITGQPLGQWRGQLTK